MAAVPKHRYAVGLTLFLIGFDLPMHRLLIILVGFVNELSRELRVKKGWEPLLYNDHRIVAFASTHLSYFIIYVRNQVKCIKIPDAFSNLIFNR